MIGSFRHKGLRNLWEKNEPKGVSANALPRIQRILAILESAEDAGDCGVPGYRFHALKGSPRRYSMRVTGNWRVTFEWSDGVAHAIDLEDYHGS
jgi:proteic killer suppression protein